MSNKNNESSNDNAPHIAVVSQYIKDLSFENPMSPGSLEKGAAAPGVDLSLDLRVAKLEGNFYEVVIHIEASAKSVDKTLFIVDLQYGGVFNLLNFPAEQHEVILAVHCPMMLFPFARKVIADVTQGGGYQPLMIDPIDFGLLFQKKMMEEQKGDSDK